jgi:putative DNA primase/helicase
MCLTGDVSEHILPIAYGGGANGKSTLLDCICGMLGEYASQAAPELITYSRHREHPTEIADLAGKRLVVVSETENAAEFRLQLVKRLTGDARLKGRYMRQDFFEFARTHKLILQTNNRPIVKENSEAVWRRLRLIPFDVTIAPDQRDPQLLDKLRMEWAGILAWAVRGCEKWRRDGLQTPQSVLDATAEYQAAEDDIGAFIDECCSTAAGLSVGATDLYSAFRTWAGANGRDASTQTAFGARIGQLGYALDRHPTTRRKIRLGIALRDQSGVHV